MTLQKLGEGKRREINWQAMAQGAITAFNTDTTTRGFTGHEMIDSVGLIHMNGRVYDPTLGRFLSADPNVQALDNLQNFNRYSYVLNNPLSYTDPTGFFFSKLFKAIGRAFGKLFKAIGRALKKLLRSPIVRAIIQIIACSNPVTCVAASGAMAAAAGGSIRDVFKAMAFSFIQMATWTVVKGVLAPIAKALGAVGKGAIAAGKAAFAAVKGFVHGIVGGALSVAQGGNFLQGFVSNALGAVAGAVSEGADIVTGTVITAIAGCAGAAISGGKCANGAITAAFAYLYNQRSTLRRYLKKGISWAGATGGVIVGAGAAVVCDVYTAMTCTAANYAMVATGGAIGYKGGEALAEISFYVYDRIDAFFSEGGTGQTVDGRITGTASEITYGQAEKICRKHCDMLYDNSAEGKHPNLEDLHGPGRDHEFTWGKCMHSCMGEYGHPWGAGS